MPASTVDGYLESLPSDARSTVNEVRQLVKQIAPQAIEVVSYGVIGYKLPPGNKRGFMFLGGYSKHISIYPVPGNTDLQASVAPYVAGKGTLHFELGKELPVKLIEKVAEALYQAAT